MGLSERNVGGYSHSHGVHQAARKLSQPWFEARQWCWWRQRRPAAGSGRGQPGALCGWRWQQLPCKADGDLCVNSAGGFPLLVDGCWLGLAGDESIHLQPAAMAGRRPCGRPHRALQRCNQPVGWRTHPAPTSRAQPKRSRCLLLSSRPAAPVINQSAIPERAARSDHVMMIALAVVVGKLGSASRGFGGRRGLIRAARGLCDGRLTVVVGGCSNSRGCVFLAEPPPGGRLPAAGRCRQWSAPMSSLPIQAAFWPLVGLP